MPNALARWRVALPCVVLLSLALAQTASAAVMRGTPKADRLIGSPASDTIRALAGRDLLLGKAGRDILVGGRGNDRILADGADRVVGGPGDDRISLTASSLNFRIECGPGQDRATITAAVGVSTRNLRKRTRGCESLKLLAGPVPAPTAASTTIATRQTVSLLAADTQPPSVPQGFTTTGKTQTTISVKWNPSTDNVGVTGYRIYRNNTLIATTTKTSYTLKNLKCGTQYKIDLAAIDAAGNESYRPEAVKYETTSACSTPTPTPTPSPTPTPDTQPPSVPQGFTTTGTTQTSISVSWNASTDNVGVTGYRIYRNDALIATTSQTSYTLTGLACGTQYKIDLAAIDAAGNESYRPEAVKYETTSACSTPTPTPSPSPTPTPTPTPPPSGTVYLSPSGSDSNACSSASPCASFARGYAAAAAGGVVSVGSGVYPKQEVPTGTKAVTFRGVSGNKVRQLLNHASNVTYDGIDVDANFATPVGAAFESDAPGVTVKNGRIGDVIDEKGSLLAGWTSTASQNVVIDNVVFHDVYQDTDGIHNECMFSESPGLTVRNSTFRNCATMDLMITRGDWWGQPTYGGVTLENNLFAHSTNGRDPNWHYFGFLVHGNMGGFTNARVVNNTFETPVGGLTAADAPTVTGVWANNIGGGWDCFSGTTYRGNVGKKCDASDVAVSPSSSCAPPTCSPAQTMPVGWVDPSTFDFHLKSTAKAINVGSATYAPARDHDGNARSGAPDAGAFEYTGAAPAPTPTPSPTPTPTPSPTPTPTPSPTPTPTPSPTPTPAPSPGPANLFVAANGNDSGSCTQAAPCKTFARAYAVASAGNVIQVAAGSYPIQTLPTGTKAVTFRGLSGNKIFQLDNSADNVTFDGLDVDAQGASLGNSAVLENRDASNVTYKNGRLGNVTDRQTAMVSGTNVTFDNMVFHDAVYRTDGVHMECVYAIGVPGFTVRNSTFHNCAIMDLFFAYGDWWTPKPPAYGGVTLENNVFEHVLNDASGTWGYYPLYVGQTGDNVLRNWTVRYNTFEQTASLETSHNQATNSRWVGNIGDWDCIPGMTYKYNVGQKCGTTDKAVSPDMSTRTTPAPFGWVNSPAADFHLKVDSVAVDAGDPTDKPATDRDGKARTGTPDAGAYER